MKIVAAAILRNEAHCLQTMVRSVSWVDTVVIYNDHSVDATDDVIDLLRNDSTLPLLERLTLSGEEPMMRYLPNGDRDIGNEKRLRNRFVKEVFAKYSPCLVLLIDGDELMSSILRPHIHSIAKNPQYDSIALSCTHLYDLSHYVHVYPATWNGVSMIDPHVRVLKRWIPYETGDYPTVPDCFIRPSERTLCLDITAHIHLKYLKCLRNRNMALRDLPQDVLMFEDSGFVRPLRSPMPADLQALVEQHV